MAYQGVGERGTACGMSAIIRRVGNLLDATSGVLVHGCNARGVMGAGLAKAVRAQYPDAYALYRRAYKRGVLAVGEVIAYPVPNGVKWPMLIVANAIIQQDYGTDERQVDYVGLERCFREVARIARIYRCSDVHFPLIGCGLAGGDWSIVAPIIERTLEGFNKYLWVLEVT